MNLLDWQLRWGIPHEAMADLRARLGMEGTCASPTVTDDGKQGSETRQQQLVRLEAPHFGVWLTRNNVGAYIDNRRIPVRYGLANESKAQNERIKSADLIGIRPVVVTMRHVGTVIGQFVSREVKHEGWHYTGDAHEQAQLAWANFVLSKGGDAGFCTGPGSFTA